MARYETPGAYIEREDRAQGGVARLRTDVAAFVGIAERGPCRRAVAIDSWKQFQAIFGGAFVHGYLAYVVRAFFENGGRRCWVVRVESEAAATASRALPAAGGTVPVWRVEANSSGAWGNALSFRLTETRRVSRRWRLATSGTAVLDSVAGLQRCDTVELLQDVGGTVSRELRVLSAVDPDGTVAWDIPLTTIDPTRPARVETIGYQLQLLRAGRLWQVYADLAPHPGHPDYGPRRVSGLGPLFAPDPTRMDPAPGRASTADLVILGTRLRTQAAPQPIRLIECRDAFPPLRLAAPDADQGLAGGGDALAALTPQDFIGIDDPAEDSAALLADHRRGIAALAEIDEISLAAVPDIHIQPRQVFYDPPPPCVPNPCLPGAGATPPKPVVITQDGPPMFRPGAVLRVLQALVTHCEQQGDRVALIDPPFAAATDARLGLAAIRDVRRQFDSSYAALYFPWLETPDPLPGARSPILPIPPCGHVAGQIAASDLRIGVHKAPANSPLLLVEQATFAIDEIEHGVLNDQGINAIRAMPGRGLRIMGARLVSSDPDWRFLNVRRLILMVERSLEAALQWAVFEGNDWLTRAKLQIGIDSFLRELWSRGALMGATAEAAFFVRCSEANNGDAARARGELLVEIGVAASVPFEFVVLRIGRSANGFAFAEADAKMVA